MGPDEIQWPQEEKAKLQGDMLERRGREARISETYYLSDCMCVLYIYIIYMLIYVKLFKKT